MEVVVPDGCAAGDVFAVMLPDGSCLDITVPNGSQAGSCILIDAPTRIEEPKEPMTERVGLTVPQGVQCGETFNVQSASGSIFEVALPEGFSAGEYMEVDLPVGPSTTEQLAVEPHMPPPAQHSPAVQSPRPHSGATPSTQSSTSVAVPSADSPPLQMTAASALSDRPASKYGDRFGSSRQQQHYFSRTVGDRIRDRHVDGSRGPIIFCRSHKLREPLPEEGQRFYEGEAIQLIRSSGEWCEGTVLEQYDGFETLYRCRLGEGILEKHLTEDELRPLQPAAGFRFAKLQVVHIVRTTGERALATVTATFTKQGASSVPEPWYSCRLIPADASAELPVVENHSEGNLQPPRPQRGCEFYAGQLVQALKPSGVYVLARVLEFVIRDYELQYRCLVVRDAMEAVVDLS